MQNNEYILENNSDKLNILGAYFESMNSLRYLNNNTRLKELVDRKVNTFVSKYIENRKQHANLHQTTQHTYQQKNITLKITSALRQKYI